MNDRDSDTPREAFERTYGKAKPALRGQRFGLWEEGRVLPWDQDNVGWGGDIIIVDNEARVEADPEAVIRYIVELEQRLAETDDASQDK